MYFNRDIVNAIRSAEKKKFAEGMAEGVAKGMAEGVAKGMAEGVAKVAKAMLAKGMAASVVAELTGLTEEQINDVAKKQ